MEIYGTPFLWSLLVGDLFAMEATIMPPAMPKDYYWESPQHPSQTFSPL